MKQNSMQRNDLSQVVPLSNSYKDELYSIFLLEFETRGIEYFNWLSMLPDLTGGLLQGEAPLTLVKRLAANPSIISVMLSKKPEDALYRMIHSDDTDIHVSQITDFLDDLTLNCRLRDPMLFDRNQDIFLTQLNTVMQAQTNMSSVEKEDFKIALDKYGYLLMTLHYLRKIGYNHASKERNRQA